MSLKEISSEQTQLLNFLKPALRSRKQLNRPHESDCEIVKLSAKSFLATSIDSFADEWAIGLYQKPETLARLCVHGTLSDLVVSGADPIGFLFSPQWGFQDPKDFKARVFKSVIEELKRVKVPLLGGDEGYAAQLSLTGVALGTSSIKPKTRVGMKAGHWLCTLGEFGVGPALGFQFLLQKIPSFLNEDLYHPTAYTKAIPAILKFAKASMDSSDGLCTTLQFLSKVNDVKFEIDANAIQIHPAALRFCHENQIPPLALWYGEIGDYQPIFSIEPKDFPKVKRLVPNLKRIGTVLPKKEKNHCILWKSEKIPFHPGQFSLVPKSTMAEIKNAFDNMIQWLKSEGLSNVGTPTP